MILLAWKWCIVALALLAVSKILQFPIQNTRCFFFSILIFREFRILGKSTSQKLHRKGTTLGPKSDDLPNPDRKKSDPNEENGPAKCEKMGRPKIKTRRPKIKKRGKFSQISHSENFEKVVGIPQSPSAKSKKSGCEK